MNLDDLLNEMSEKIKNRDLSDEYLREHNNSTREEIGIEEYAYGITMIPCEWVYEYLSYYKRVLKENEKLKDKLLDTLEGQKVIKEETPQYIKENYIPVEKVKDKIEELNNVSNAEELEDIMDRKNYTITELVQYVLQELLESEE